MPSLHDPALRTPERVRAINALLLLGLIHLVFITGLSFYFIFYCITHAMNGYPSFILLSRIFTSVAVLPATGGVAAMAAATAICQRHWRGLRLGRTANVIALVFFLLAWFVFFGFYIFAFSVGYFLFLAYLCGGSILAGMSALRCTQLRKAERRGKSTVG